MELIHEDVSKLQIIIVGTFFGMFMMPRYWHILRAKGTSLQLEIEKLPDLVGCR